MAATFSDLVDEIIGKLQGFTADQGQYCTLETAIDADDLVLEVDDATQLNVGLVEIDSELIYVSAVNRTANSATIPAWGRGQQGTTAAAHSFGARISTAPRFPRHRVKAVINQVVRSTFPDLFQVKVTTLAASAGTLTYELPSDVRSIVSVSWSVPGSSDLWWPVKRYRLNRNANSTAFDTGVSLDILEPMTPGRTVQVAYRAEPAELSSESDVFTTTTGLQESCRDLVGWGALAQLLPALEFARLNTDSIEQSDRQRLVQPGSASAAARQALQMYSLRLEQERQKLQVLNPATAHLTR